MALRAKPLGGPLAFLVVVFVLATTTFIKVMYDGRVTGESLVEATHYAAQTITTVGYGNWETPARSIGQPLPLDHGEKVFRMRLWSVPLMLLGATLYALLIGVWVALMLN